jgi:hypothetical protein
MRAFRDRRLLTGKSDQPFWGIGYRSGRIGEPFTPAAMPGDEASLLRCMSLELMWWTTPAPGIEVP